LATGRGGLGSLAIITFILIAVAQYMIFMYVPNDATLGLIQRIFYFHVASAWNALLAFTVVFGASLAYLAKGERRWDALALSAAEIGVLFTTLVLITGPIWGKVSWNQWWTWDPRLTTTLILWFIYLAYLLVRMAADEPEKRARFAAVFGIIGFVDVPIVFFSIRWWRTIHPIVISWQGAAMEPSMLRTMIVSFVAFSFLFLYLLVNRLRVEVMQDEVAQLKERLQ
jgi:heme exporter protein C